VGYLTQLEKLARHPASAPSLLAGVARYLANDLGALAGRYRYPHRIIFIAGLPKSGTTWMQNQLARLPGYNIRRIRDPDGAVNTRDVTHAIFESLPRNRYSVVKLHTRYSASNYEVIRAHVPRFLVMIRDLRDMCVSRYFHVRNDPSSPHHPKYRDAGFEEGLMDSIEVLRDNYVPWVADWYRVAGENPTVVKLVRYETLGRDPGATFRDVLEFFGVPADPGMLESMARSRLQRSRDLAAQLSRNTWIVRSTEREGEIGSWRRHFSEAHKQRFKEIAGALLVELGYERDLDW
jgi:hypothetical protein